MMHPKDVRKKVREALEILQRKAVDVKDAGTGEAIMAINLDDIVRQVLGK